MAQLIHLEADDPDSDISLYINSPGGDVYAGLAIYDTMQFVKPDVQTICFGIAMSMGAVLLAGGAPGKRLALPNSRMMIHQAWTGGFQGPASDIEIHASERSSCSGGSRRSSPSTPARTSTRCTTTSTATTSSPPRRPGSTG